MINKYRKKPVEIEALQYTGDNISEICKFMHKDINHVMSSGHVYIETLEGIMEASKGDYIIKGIEGEFYPCKPDIFAKTYEAVRSTQFDHIKAMSIDELAKWLAIHIDNYRAPYDVKEMYRNAIDATTGKGIIWIEAFKRWLEQEVSE